MVGEISITSVGVCVTVNWGTGPFPEGAVVLAAMLGLEIMISIVGLPVELGV